MKETSKKVILLLLTAILLLIPCTNIQASAVESTSTQNQSTIYQKEFSDKIFLNVNKKKKLPTQVQASTNLLTNFIQVDYKFIGNTINVRVVNYALDSLDYTHVRIVSYVNGKRSLSTNDYVSNLGACKSFYTDLYSPGATEAVITVTTTDGGESYTKTYYLSA